jgi:hypothetical protein
LRPVWFTPPRGAAFDLPFFRTSIMSWTDFFGEHAGPAHGHMAWSSLHESF